MRKPATEVSKVRYGRNGIYQALPGGVPSQHPSHVMDGWKEHGLDHVGRPHSGDLRWKSASIARIMTDGDD
jgi:hypothetical protein